MQEKTLHYDWIDAANGLGIIFVVLGHAIADTTQNVQFFGKLFQIIYSFHMPLFFFLSGFCGIKALQKRKLHEEEAYILERFKRLMVATVYKGNIIKNLIMDCQSYTKYRPNETTGGIFVSWRRKEELPTGA